MKLVSPLCLLIALAVGSAPAAVTVRPSSRTRGRIDIVATHAPLAEVTRALERYLAQPVSVDAVGERLVTYVANDIAPSQALTGVAAAAHAVIDRSHGLVLREAGEPTVTLDVKDEDIRIILKSVQRQCGIRNLIVDPDVAGSGTFLFDRVPCHTALNAILKTMGLGHYSDSSDVIAVGHQPTGPVH
jgi:type II secretory pathway component GspD/PulD (secretin)